VEFRVVTGRLAPYRFQWCGLHQHENRTTLPSGLSALCGHLSLFPKSFQIPPRAALDPALILLGAHCVDVSIRPQLLFVTP
jgi:hypothetical protein